MQSISLRLTGMSPLLMHNGRSANPLDPEVKMHKSLTGKRKKTDADQEAIAASEWRISLYFDDDIGPYMPGGNVLAAMRDGARMSKKGRDISRGLLMEAERLPLIYKGPRTIDKLQADPAFTDLRMVGVQRVKLLRCRPIFREWALEPTFFYDPDIFNRETVIEIAMAAGKYCGLGDYRPSSPSGGSHGRFDVEEI